MKDIKLMDKLTRDEAEQLEKILDITDVDIPYRQQMLQELLAQRMDESINKSSKGQEEQEEKRKEKQKEQQINPKEKFQKPRRGKKRKCLALIAAVIMLMGTVTLAASKDWDIQMAERLGLSGVMEQLEGGYVVIDQTQIQGEASMTVTQAIGDSNCQWIEIDTNIPWEAGAKEAYGVKNCTLKVYPSVPTIHPDGQGGFQSFCNLAFQFLSEKPGGYSLHCYEKDGTISMMLSAMDYENLNRSLIQLEIKDLRLYHGEEDGEGTGVSDATFCFSWKNYYDANTKNIKLNQDVTLRNDEGTEWNCTLKKLQVTPVSLRLEAKAEYVSSGSFLYIDSIKMKDGTIIPCGTATSGGVNSIGGSHISLESFLSLIQDFGMDSGESDLSFSVIDGTQIESITVGGVEISVDQ